MGTPLDQLRDSVNGVVFVVLMDSGEIKNLKETQEKLTRRIKSEKATALTKLEESHRADLDALEAKQKSSHDFLLRRHQEEQRDLLDSASRAIQRNIGRDFLAEIQKLQLQLGDYERRHAENEKFHSESQARQREDSQTVIGVLEAKLQKEVTKTADTQRTIADTQRTIAELQDALSKTRAQHISVENRIATEVAAKMEENDAEYRKMVSLVEEAARASAEEKLTRYQEISSAHVEKLQRQLADFTCVLQNSKHGEEKVKNQLYAALQRNQELEQSQAFIERRLRQTCQEKFSSGIGSSSPVGT